MNKPVVQFMGPRQAIEDALRDQFEILKLTDATAQLAVENTRAYQLGKPLLTTGV